MTEKPLGPPRKPAPRKPAPRKPAPWSRPREEPRLSDLLADPIIRMLMDRDRVCPTEIMNLSTRFLKGLAIAGR